MSLLQSLFETSDLSVSSLFFIAGILIVAFAGYYQARQYEESFTGNLAAAQRRAKAYCPESEERHSSSIVRRKFWIIFSSDLWLLGCCIPVVIGVASLLQMHLFSAQPHTAAKLLLTLEVILYPITCTIGDSAKRKPIHATHIRHYPAKEYCLIHFSADDLEELLLRMGMDNTADTKTKLF